MFQFHYSANTDISNIQKMFQNDLGHKHVPLYCAKIIVNNNSMMIYSTIMAFTISHAYSHHIIKQLDGKINGMNDKGNSAHLSQITSITSLKITHC